MPWLGVHEAADVKKMEWLVAAALDWRCLALTPASFLDQLLCDAWQGPLRSLQQADACYFTYARGFAVKLLSSTLTGVSAAVPDTSSYLIGTDEALLKPWAQVNWVLNSYSVSSKITLSGLLCCRANELSVLIHCQHSVLISALHTAVRTLLEECMLLFQQLLYTLQRPCTSGLRHLHTQLQQYWWHFKPWASMKSCRICCSTIGPCWAFNRYLINRLDSNAHCHRLRHTL